MDVMFLLFFGFSFLALVIFGVLFIVIKRAPWSARYIEIIGYALLAISLIWNGVAIVTEGMSNDSEYLKLNEKLNILWRFNGDLKDFSMDKNEADLVNDYSNLNNYWYEANSDNKLIKEQEETVKKISYGLFVLSSLFIAAGRLEELFKKNEEKGIKKKRVTRRTKKRKGVRQIK